MSAPADTGIPGRGIVSCATESCPTSPSLVTVPPVPLPGQKSQSLSRTGRAARPATSSRHPWRTVFLGQFADNGRIGGVDGLEELIVGDGAADSQRVPPGATNVSHHRRVIRV